MPVDLDTSEVNRFNLVVLAILAIALGTAIIFVGLDLIASIARLLRWVLSAVFILYVAKVFRGEWKKKAKQENN